MDDNQKKFNAYVFISTFARCLIEVFIPIILYTYGFSLKEVILYFVIVNIFSLIFTAPFIKLSIKYNNKILSFISILAFICLQVSLNCISNSIWYLVIVAFLYSIYRIDYWMARRYYSLQVINNEKMGKTISIISIVNQLGLIISTYVGSLFLDYSSIEVLTGVSIILFLISIIPLAMLKIPYEKIDRKIEFIKTFKEIPKRNIFLFGTYEIMNTVKLLVPLYLFIYVSSNYQIVGILSLVTNVATLIFTYFYGLTIDKNKNFFKTSIILTVIIYFFKVNVITSALVLISFIEGIINKMYELSIAKHFYELSNKFEYENYNLIYELTLNFSRLLNALVLYFFISDLKMMIYVTLAIVLLGAFVNFKYIEKEDFIVKEIV